MKLRRSAVPVEDELGNAAEKGLADLGAAAPENKRFALFLARPLSGASLTRNQVEVAPGTMPSRERGRFNGKRTRMAARTRARRCPLFRLSVDACARNNAANSEL